MAIRARMQPHDAAEAHRASTSLELFFDLVFVIAVAQAAAALHHGLVEGHAATAVVAFLFVFFAIWWAWMNFTWFASAYDTDDVAYRLSAFVIMIGALILAAGAGSFVTGTPSPVMTIGYAVMRVAMVALWLRAAASFPEGRTTALRYAIGIAVLQLLWLSRLAVVERFGLVSFLVLAAAELALPYWAELAGRTAWHPAHIAERYSLFTIIVLGEALFAATAGVQTVLDSDEAIGEIVPIIIGGLLLVFSMWWIYFALPGQFVISAAHEGGLGGRRGVFLWGYGHYVVFASIAATGAGIGVAIDHAMQAGHASDLAAGLAVAVPVSIFLLAVWAMESPLKDPISFRTWAIPLTIALMLASSITAEPVLLCGVALTVLLVAGTALIQWRPFVVPPIPRR